MKKILARMPVVLFLVIFFFGSSLTGWPGVRNAYAVTTVIFLVSPTGSNQTWNVPSDWNNADNSIEVIGAGGGGSASQGSAYTGAGGGGGAYSAITNLTLTPSGTATFRVGTGGTAGVGDGGDGGDTWFNGTTLAGSSAGAKGGIGAINGTRGLGGASSGGIGTVKNSGGAGGVEANIGGGATGAGGAGGPGGVGANGGTSGGSSIEGGSGGGGNGAGGTGVNTTTNGNGTSGGTASDSTAGGGGGAAGNPAVSGSSGSHGSGGGGGGRSTDDASAAGDGGTGGAGQEYDSSHGSGGGGGGGGSAASNSTYAGNGGAGGLYGGGGGGGAYNYDTSSFHGAGGAGGQGIIVITYTPAGGAGTLSCTIRSGSCSGGEVEIYEMQSMTNSHAGLPAASYSNLVCCSGVSGMNNNCSGTFATVLKLSGTTDAHVRQGTLSDYPSATNACISVPGGGSVSVGYQATNCAGWDTSLGAMIGTTNSHVGSSSWAAGTTKICATAVGAGTLSADIVDSGGTPVSAPSIVIGAVPFSLAFQTGTGTFGATAQKVRVTNTTANPQWTLAIAAAGGPTSLLSAGTPKYDYNDPTASAVDGGDADAYGGQMTLDPVAGTLGGTCSSTNITKGSSAAFSQAVIDSITLMTAATGSDTGCYWDLTGVGVSQTIPAEQAASGSYSINMTLTVTSY